MESYQNIVEKNRELQEQLKECLKHTGDNYYVFTWLPENSVYEAADYPDDVDSLCIYMIEETEEERELIKKQIELCLRDRPSVDTAAIYVESSEDPDEKIWNVYFEHRATVLEKKVQEAWDDLNKALIFIDEQGLIDKFKEYEKVVG